MVGEVKLNPRVIFYIQLVDQIALYTVCGPTTILTSGLNIWQERKEN